MKKPSATILIIVGVLVAGIAFTLYTVSRGPGKMLERAQAAIQAGDPNKAIGLLEALLEDHPDLYEAHLLMGQARISLHDFDAARQEAKKVTDLRPKEATGHIFAASIDRIEAGDVLGKPAVMVSETSVQETMALLENGLKKLAEAGDRKPPQPGMTEEGRGLLWRAKVRAFELQAALKRQAAGQASRSGQADEAEQLLSQAEDVTEQMNQARMEAIQHLQAAHRQNDELVQSALAALDVALGMGVLEPVADIVASVKKGNVKHPGLYLLTAQLIAQQDRYGFNSPFGSKLEEALALMETGIKAYPDNLDLQVLAGRLELELGNREAGLRYINDVLTRSPQHRGALTERGRALTLSGSYGEAKALLQQFRSGGKADLRRSRYLAQALLRNGEVDTGRKMLRDILDLVSDDVDARLTLVESLSDAGRFEEADDLLKEGAAAVPTSTDFVTARVVLAVRRGRREDAQTILKKAFATGPDSDSALETFTGLTLMLGAQQPMRSALSGVAERMADRPIGQLAQAGVRLADGELDGAWSAIETLSAAKPELPAVRFARARILVARGDREGAAEAIEQAVLAASDNPFILHQAAVLYARMGWSGSALLQCEEILIQSPHQPAVQLLAAEQALFTNKAARSAELIADLRNKVDDLPVEPLTEAILAYHDGDLSACISACDKVKSVETLWLSALAAGGLGQSEEARRRTLAAIDLDPHRPELFQLCAKNFHDAGQREEGIRTFRKLAAKHPAHAKLGEALLALFVQDWAGAAKHFKEIINTPLKGLTRRTGFAVRLGLGTCYASLGQTDQLGRFVDSLVEDANLRFGESIEAVDFLARVNAADRALRVLEALEQKVPANSISAWRRKQITDRYARMGQVERAVSIYDRLLDTRPLVPAFHSAKINLLRQAGRTEEAWQAVNRAVEILPTEIGFRTAQARMLSENYRFKEAFEKLESLKLSNPSAHQVAVTELSLLCSRIGLHEETLRILSPADEDDSERRRLARVNAYLGMGQIDKAVAECKKIPAATPAYRTGRVAIAQHHVRQEEFDQALAIIKDLASGEHPFPSAQRDILQILRKAGRSEEVIKLADEQLSKMAPGLAERVDWLGAKGQAALQLNQFDIARTCWEELVQLVPANQVLATQLAALSYADGDTERASAILKTASTKNYVGDLLRTLVLISSQDAVAAKEMLKGIAVEQMGPAYRQCAALLSIAADGLADTPIGHWQAPPVAEKLLTSTSKWAKDPTKRDLIRLAATCLLLTELQLPQVGQRFGQRVVVEAPEIPLGLWVMTTTYDRMGDAEKSLATLRTLVEKFSDQVSARDALIARLIQSNQLDEAEKALTAWTGSGGKPEASYAWSQGAYWAARKKQADSISWFEKCLKADPGFVPAKAKLAAMLVRQPSSDKATRQRAIDLSRELAQADPRNPEYKMTLGWGLALNEEYDEATVYLNAALVMLPQNAELHYRLGWTYRKNGQAAMAKRHYRQAVAYGLTDPTEAEAAKSALESLQNPTDTQPAAPAAG